MTDPVQELLTRTLRDPARDLAVPADPVPTIRRRARAQRRNAALGLAAVLIVVAATLLAPAAAGRFTRPAPVATDPPPRGSGLLEWPASGPLAGDARLVDDAIHRWRQAPQRVLAGSPRLVWAGRVRAHAAAAPARGGVGHGDDEPGPVRAGPGRRRGRPRRRPGRLADGRAGPRRPDPRRRHGAGDVADAGQSRPDPADQPGLGWRGPAAAVGRLRRSRDAHRRAARGRGGSGRGRCDRGPLHPGPAVRPQGGTAVLRGAPGRPDLPGLDRLDRRRASLHPSRRRHRRRRAARRDRPALRAAPGPHRDRLVLPHNGIRLAGLRIDAARPGETADAPSLRAPVDGYVAQLPRFPTGPGIVRLEDDGGLTRPSIRLPAYEP